MISVVIPLYNKESQIADTLRTVLAQTYTDFEVVVVNDGSTDKSAEIVASFSDPRIRLINQTNAGVSAARNHGIREAQGEYIALLDADDEWHPDYLSTQMTLAEEYPECEVFATNYEFKDTSGKVTPTIIRNLPFNGDHGILSNYFEVAATSHPPICSISIMARKQAFDSIGGFPLGIKSGEDLLTWARLACKYKIAYNNTPKASFINDPQAFNEDQKQRDVSIGDEVGSELKMLYRTYRTPGLRSYIGLWYKMRARIYLSKHQRLKALSEVGKSIRYNRNAKIFVFLGMCFLPNAIVNKLFAKFG